MKIRMDPNKQFEDVQVTRIVDAVGILPVFAEAAYVAYPSDPTARQVFDEMMKAYGMGFGDGTTMEVTITPSGTWVSNYEEDEDLHPLVKLFWEDVTIYLYQHALVAIVGPDTTLATRMD
jgi:hypothetical protein